MAPSCMEGPSLPRENPDTIQRVPPIIFAINTLIGFWDKYPFISPLT